MSHRRALTQTLVAVLLALGSAATVRADFEAQYQLSPGEALAANAKFGFSVSIAGDLAVVGAYFGDGTVLASGAAYVYERDGLGWHKIAKLVADDGLAGDNFGTSVSISAEPGNVNARIAVGAPGVNHGFIESFGAVYVFERNAGGTWRQTSKFMADTLTNVCPAFGRSVAIDGDVIAVGSPGCGTTWPHHAYVFERDPESPTDSSSWVQTAMLESDVPTGTQSDFGLAVDAGGDLVVVGARLENEMPGGATAGAAYVFRRWGWMDWRRDIKLEVSDPNDVNFGRSVSLSGDRCMVGATEGSQRGVIYIFEYGDTAWSQVYRRKAEDLGSGSVMGTSVAISGNGAIAGAPGVGSPAGGGAVQTFLKSPATGWAPQILFRLAVPVSADQFGVSADLSGQRAIVGAPGRSGGKGAAFIFEPIAPQGLSVSGTVYESIAPDSACTPTGPGIEGRLVLASSKTGAVPDQMVTTHPDGTYTLGLPEGEYTVRLLPKANWFQTCPVDGASPLDYDLLVDRDMTGLDFATAGGADLEDLSVDVYAMGPVETGHSFVYAVTGWNRGTVPLDATVTLDLPDSVTFQTASDGGVLVDRQVIWTHPIPADSAIYRQAAVQVNLGTFPPYLLSASAHIDPRDADVDPADNDDDDDSWVAGSFDPNDKVVFPEGSIQVDQQLTYHIRFQNVGTADADDIVVRDTLDDRLDLSTLVPGATSHPCSVSMYGREIVWTFTGIHLPDSTTDEPGSHGFVSFSITPRADLEPGTVVPNQAGIYFDFNPVVLTNTVGNMIADVAGVLIAPPAGTAASMISFYSAAPNPGADRVTFRIGLVSPGTLNLEVFDIRGRRVRTLRRTADAGVSSLTWDGRDEQGEPAASGVYFARVRLDSDRGPSATATRRLIRIR